MNPYIDPTTNDRGIWKKALWLVPLIVGIGFVMGAVSNSGYGNAWFERLEEPSFMPPGWLFGAAWSTFYTMMAIALAVVLNEPRSPKRKAAVGVFVLHLLLNYAWSPIYFYFHEIVIAKWLLLAILVLATVATGRFWRIRPLAGMLLIPYLGWLIFAFMLNSAFVALNPGVA